MAFSPLEGEMTGLASGRGGSKRWNAVPASVGGAVGAVQAVNAVLASGRVGAVMALKAVGSSSGALGAPCW